MYSDVIYKFELTEKGSCPLVLKILWPSNRILQKKMGAYVQDFELQSGEEVKIISNQVARFWLRWEKRQDNVKARLF